MAVLVVLVLHAAVLAHLTARTHLITQVVVVLVHLVVHHVQPTVKTPPITPVEDAPVHHAVPVVLPTVRTHLTTPVVVPVHLAAQIALVNVQLHVQKPVQTIVPELAVMDVPVIVEADVKTLVQVVVGGNAAYLVVVLALANVPLGVLHNVLTSQKEAAGAVVLL